MKKVLALVLAVMMMATVAFAASMDCDTVVNPGSGSSTDDAGWKPGKTINITALGISQVPGSPYKFADSGFVAGSSKLLKDINSSNYSITSIKYNDGKNMVSGITFNDAKDRVEIKLNKDYDLTKVKKLDVTFTLKGKKSGKSDRPADIDIHVTKDVNFGTRKILIDADNETDFVESWVEDVDDLYVYEVEDNGAAWGTLEFAASDDEAEVEVRVYDGDKLYLYNNMDANDDVLKAYADVDADISFLNFVGEPTFNATATVRFYKEEDWHIYGVKDGKLTNVNAKWDDDEGCFILKTRTLGSYVFSDKALSVAATTPGTNNPDTGANDVVGIAGALAAVALVSAAAVSLKK